MVPRTRLMAQTVKRHRENSKERRDIRTNCSNCPRAEVVGEAVNRPNARWEAQMSEKYPKSMNQHASKR